MLEKGVLPHVVPLLLGYDPTLSPEVAAALAVPFSPPSSGNSSNSSSADASSTAAGGGGGGGSGQGAAEGLKLLDSGLVRVNMSEARSQHALLASRALARLAGEGRVWFQSGPVFAVLFSSAVMDFFVNASEARSLNNAAMHTASVQNWHHMLVLHFCVLLRACGWEQ